MSRRIYQQRAEAVEAARALARETGRPVPRANDRLHGAADPERRRAGTGEPDPASAGSRADTVREHLGSIAWPNGLGFTPCTIEYEEAVVAMRDAAEDHEHAPSPETYEAHCRAEQRVLCLQAEGGHLGEPVHLSHRDPIIALMGGGSVTATELRAILLSEG